MGRQVCGAQIARPHDLQVVRHLGNRLVDGSSQPLLPASTRAGVFAGLDGSWTQPRTRSGTFLRRSSTPSEGDVGPSVQAETVVDPARLNLARRVEVGQVDTVLHDVDALVNGIEQSLELVPGGLRRYDDAGGPPDCGACRRDWRWNLARTALCSSGPEKKVTSADRHDDRHGGGQRQRVVGRGDQFCALTCWATSGNPVCSHARRAGRWEIAEGPAMTRAPAPAA